MTARLHRSVAAINTIILGKEVQIKLGVTALLARGHLLIEDLPGVGKTTLSHAIAHALGLEFNRVQFTSDLLPSDILGATIYEKEREQFRFHPGPIFSQVILADEINRANPKTQSALLEAMEEYQVSIEGTSHPLPQPFFVIATQNPSEQIGTYALPESQLDRFLMVISLGYPSAAAERDLLLGNDRREMLAALKPELSGEDLLQLQREVRAVKVTSALIDYVMTIVTFTRQSGLYRSGLSPRAALSILNAARAWALLEQREYVRPDDVQAILPAVAGHRLRRLSRYEGEESGGSVITPLLELAIP
ncbi:MAG: AAA family ATPase [Gammaproteobacteria bacterium]|nr:AAA family ATPase [Gammaproteobacteria bacterium]